MALATSASGQFPAPTPKEIAGMLQGLMPLARPSDAATDAAMERYASGDAAAFSDLYDGLAPRLYGYLLRQTKDFSRAEDLVQQTMLQIHCARGQFVRRAAVVPWAFAISRRLLIDETRREAARRRQVEAAEALADAEPSSLPADEVAHAAQLARMIRRELDRLPEEQRISFELVDQEGLTHVQAAEVLGTTVSAIKRSAQKTYAGLRATIGAVLEKPRVVIDASLDLKQRILRAAEATPTRSRQSEAIRAALFIGTAIAASLVIFALRGGIRLTGRPLSLVLGTTIGTTLIAGASIWVSLGRGRSMLGRSRAWILAAMLASPLALLGWKVFWSAQFAQGLDAWPGRVGFRCLVLSLAVGALPLAGVVMSRRGTDPRHPQLTGSAIGAGAGLGAAVLVDMWCPVAYVPHLLLGHILPIALLALIGFWLGKTLLTLRSSREPSPLSRRLP